MHTNPSQNQIAANETDLDGMIAALEPPNSDASAVLLEHLKGAKMYLLGGMPEEYGLELEMAREEAAAIPNRDLRESTSKMIDRLRKDLASSDATRPANQAPIHHRLPHESSDTPHGRLWDFFGSAPVKLGTFYPTSFIATVLPSYRAAEDAVNALRAAGFEEQDVIAVPGEEMSAFLGQLRGREGAWGQLMAALSRMIGTEQLFTDLDRDLARSGSGFVFIYCPNDDESKLILDTVRPFAPVFMQRYLAGAVEGMIKPSGVAGPER
jgi:hypothetical protein